MNDDKLPGTQPMTKHNDGGYREGEPIANAEKMAEMDGAAAESPMAQDVPEPRQTGPLDAAPEAGEEENPKQTSMSGERATPGGGVPSTPVDPAKGI